MEVIGFREWIIIRRVRRDVFVHAAHTPRSCVKAKWGVGEGGGSDEVGLCTAACPCVTHRNSRPPSSSRPLCPLYVYERKVPLDKDGDSAF